MFLKVFISFSLLNFCFLQQRINGYVYKCNTDEMVQKLVTRTSTAGAVCGNNQCKHACRPNNANFCGGGPCQSFIHCHCVSELNANNAPPEIGCWTPGESVTDAYGKCNNTIAKGTAVASFYPTGVFCGQICGAFMGCKNDNTALVLLQGCGHPMKVREIPISDGKTCFLQILNLEEVDLLDTSLLACREQPKTTNTCVTAPENSNCVSD